MLDETPETGHSHMLVIGWILIWGRPSAAQRMDGDGKFRLESIGSYYARLLGSVDTGGSDRRADVE